MAHLDYQADAQPSPLPHRDGGLYRRAGKRLMDTLLAIALFPFIAPMIAGLCLLARRDGAPGLFAHTRVGQNGALFTCWKIRTMVPQAEAQLSTHLRENPQAAAEWKRTQKLQNDPRVTPLGRFLRRTSLDELPQIWNVLRGEMSLVGPRPVTEPELDRYGLQRHVYLSQKPGITGLWQVTGRNDGCYAERLRMDQTYASTLSPLRDVVLIARTAVVLVRPTGR